MRRGAPLVPEPRLEVFWERNDPRRLPTAHVQRFRQILALLEDADHPNDVDLVGLHFHPLTGEMTGRFAVTVRASWPIFPISSMSASR